MPKMGERKHINSGEVNKNKDGEKYTKNIITRNYITREHMIKNNSLNYY
jgi:hypothetical protein